MTVPDQAEDPAPAAERIRAALDSIWCNVTFDGVAEALAEAVVALTHRAAARVLLERPDSPGAIVATVGTWDTGRRWVSRLFGDGSEATDNPLRDRAGLALGQLSTRPRTQHSTDAGAAATTELLAAQAGLAAGYLRLEERARRFQQDAAASRNELAIVRTALQIVLGEASQGISIVSVKPEDYGKQLHANDAFGRLVGWSVAELAGTPLLELFPPDGRRALADSLRRAAGGRRRSPSTRHVQVRTRAGELRHVRVTITPVLDAEHTPQFAVCLVEPMTDKDRSAAQQLLTRTDPDALAERITRAIRDAQRYEAEAALVLCDLTDLDRIFAEAGSGNKQELVNELVNRVRASLRSDDTVNQLGDDVLTLLLPDTDSRDALTAAARVRNLLDQVAREHGHEVRQQIGVTVIDSHSDPTTAVDNARTAMRGAAASSTRIRLYPDPSPAADTAGSPQEAEDAPTDIIRYRRRGGLRRGIAD